MLGQPTSIIRIIIVLVFSLFATPNTASCFWTFGTMVEQMIQVFDPTLLLDRLLIIVLLMVDEGSSSSILRK